MISYARVLAEIDTSKMPIEEFEVALPYVTTYIVLSMSCLKICQNITHTVICLDIMKLHVDIRLWRK